MYEVHLFEPFHLGWVHSCQLCSHIPSLAAEWNNTLRLSVPVLSGCLEVMKHSELSPVLTRDPEICKMMIVGLLGPIVF